MDNKHFQRNRGDGLEDVIARKSQGRGELVGRGTFPLEASGRIRLRKN